MLNKKLLNNNHIKKIEPFCIDFTNSTKDGSVTISTNTQNSFNYSIDNESYNQLANAGDTISVPKGSKLYMRGVNKVASLFTSITRLNGWDITGDNVKLSGNIQDLLNDSDNDSLTKPYTFANLFYDNFSSIDASELILPATTLADYCYINMFYDCTHLTAAPQLPATTLADNCYSSMFNECIYLTTAPQLPATTLADNCYDSMFYGCIRLIAAPELPATTLANRCYSSMFYDCSNLKIAPQQLPATTLAYSCYDSMFLGCGNLIAAPELPATTLVGYCYHDMFCYCQSLNYIKCLATDISAYSCTYRWLNGVSLTGTFIKNSAMNSWTTGMSGIPSGWTVQNA